MMLFCLIVKKLSMRHYYDAHFIKDETEAQRS